ncbi:hypothetical protein ACLB2K_007416 [Fragaria x ananassa]
MVVHVGNYAMVLWDGDAGFVVNGDWEPGDLFLPSHVVTLDAGVVLRGQPYLIGFAAKCGQCNGAALTAVAFRSGVSRNAACVMPARVFFGAALARLCLAWDYVNLSAN